MTFIVPGQKLVNSLTFRLWSDVGNTLLTYHRSLDTSTWLFFATIINYPVIIKHSTQHTVSQPFYHYALFHVTFL